MDDHWHLRASVLTMLLLAMSSIADGCGRTEFSVVNGSISSVNYPYQYPNSIDCTYSIRSPGLQRYIYIRFTDFDTEETHDTVQIWCSTSVSSLQTFSGRHANVSSVQLQPCNSVKVRFKTDGSVASRGFNLVFYWLFSSSTCGKTEFRDLSGFITSANYPNSYSPGINCTYSIRSPGLHQSVFIEFTDFDTEVKHDMVQIWCSTEVTRILSISGRSAGFSSFTLQPCNDVKVKFLTDHSVQGRGFKLLFNWTLPSEQTTISSPTTEPTSMPSLRTETDGMQALGSKTLSLLVVVLASLLGVSVFIIILMSIIFAIWRVKRRKNAMRTRLDVCGVGDTRGRSNDGYSLDPISTRQRRPVSVKSELEEPEYEIMESPNDNDDDDDEYENAEGIGR